MRPDDTTEDESVSDESSISLSGQAIAHAVTDNDSLAAALSESDMTMRDFIVLSFVSDQESITAGRLARLVGMDLQSTQNSIGSLIKVGLLYSDMGVVEEERQFVTTDSGNAIAARILGKL